MPMLCSNAVGSSQCSAWCPDQRLRLLHWVQDQRRPPAALGLSTLADSCRSLPAQLRLRHRVLDLRRPAMARNLRLRHAIVRCIRRFLEDEQASSSSWQLLCRTGAAYSCEMRASKTVQLRWWVLRGQPHADLLTGTSAAAATATAIAATDQDRCLLTSRLHLRRLCCRAS